MTGLDLSTPQAAITTLEEAYATRDIEMAVAAKDFCEEARRMLVNLKPEYADKSELVTKASEALELAYRKQIAAQGFPDLEGVRSTLSAPQVLSHDLVKLVETCVYPDGTVSKQDLHVFKSARGWRLITMPQS